MAFLSWPYRTWRVRGWPGMWIVYPNHLKGFLAIQMELVELRISVWGTRSFQKIPRIFWKQLMWKASKFVIWRLYKVRVTAIYSKVETNCIVDCNLGTDLQVMFLKIPLRRQPKAEEVLLMRVHSSPSRAQLEDSVEQS